MCLTIYIIPYIALQYAEDSFKIAMDNLAMPEISEMDTWLNTEPMFGGGVKARAMSVLGGARKSMSIDGGSARSSARDSARNLLLDAPAHMVATSPRLMELMYRVSSTDMAL